MNSIRKKLFFYIGGLIFLLVGLTILANSIFMEPYSVQKQKDVLLQAFNIINSYEEIEYTENIRGLLLIENNNRIDILIKDSDDKIIYNTEGYSENQQAALSAQSQNKQGDSQNSSATQLPERRIYNKEIIDDNIIISWINNPHLNSVNLVLSGNLENGNSIELKMPLAAIKANIRLYNRFALIIGLVVFVISMVFAFIVSNHFTKPIIQINTATEKLKNLDFETKCIVKSKDEIGQLAQSINEMSQTLAENSKALLNKNAQLKVEIKEKIRLDEKRKELLNNVSHELKTPLALMQGYAEGLILNVSKNKEQSEFYCNVIMDEANKMNQLVDNLLNLNSLEFGDTSIKRSKFEINTFIENILMKYNKVFEDKNIDCSICKSTPTNVYADEFMMESVFTNYLNNAVNYVDENRKITICIIDNSEKIRVDVFNTAEAFSNDDIDRIWGSFYKVDKARTREKGGHGLGLSIVKAIQESHGNKYGVINKDKGVCFYFELDKV